MEKQYACILCGWDKGTLDQHRIKPGREGGKYENGNILHLCPNCHRLEHHRTRKPPKRKRLTMPFKDPMTWIADEKRWIKGKSKKTQGKVYHFSPAKHNVEPTENASREAMRTWWAGQEAILNASVNEESKARARMFLNCFMQVRSDNRITTFNDTDIAKNLVNDMMDQTSTPSFVATATDMLYGPGKHDELKHLAENVFNVVVKPTEKSRLISFQIDVFDTELTQEVIRGANKSGSLRVYRGHLGAMKDHFGKATIDTLDDEGVKGYWSMLVERGLSADTIQGHERTFKRFVVGLADKKLIPMPYVLTKIRKRVKLMRRKKTPWTVEMFQAELAKASGVKRLVLLLAANCSMYASDCSECLENFDAVTGTIDKSRFKTSAVDVLFHLWPETIEAMKEHGHELKALYTEGMKDGKPFTCNKTRVWKFPLPLKQLRHTTHTFLQNSDHAKYTDYMTGLAASGISKIFYAHNEQDKVKVAFMYLRGRYGFAGQDAI